MNTVMGDYMVYDRHSAFYLTTVTGMVVDHCCVSVGDVCADQELSLGLQELLVSLEEEAALQQG